MRRALADRTLVCQVRSYSLAVIASTIPRCRLTRFDHVHAVEHICVMRVVKLQLHDSRVRFSDPNDV